MSRSTQLNKIFTIFDVPYIRYGTQHRAHILNTFLLFYYVFSML